MMIQTHFGGFGSVGLALLPALGVGLVSVTSTLRFGRRYCIRVFLVITLEHRRSRRHMTISPLLRFSYYFSSSLIDSSHSLPSLRRSTPYFAVRMLGGRWAQRHCLLAADEHFPYRFVDTGVSVLDLIG